MYITEKPNIRNKLVIKHTKLVLSVIKTILYSYQMDISTFTNAIFLFKLFKVELYK